MTLAFAMARWYGLSYTLGRTIIYLGLSIVLIASLSSIPLDYDNWFIPMFEKDGNAYGKINNQGS